jgi:hypothetical protein
MDLDSWVNGQTRNAERLPNDLNVLAATGYVERLVQLADPRSPTAPPRGEMSHAEGLAWIATLNDYVYLGKGKRANQISPQSILAYENPDRVTGDIDVLYADSHVGTLTRAQLSQILGVPIGDPTHAPPARVPGPGCVPDPQIMASAANLFVLGYDVLQYGQSQTRNSNNFPPDLSTLAAASGATAATFVNPREPNPVQPPTLTRDQTPAWVAAHSDYVYVGAHKRLSSSANTLVAYENPAGMKGGLLMLFADGRVEFREMRWALETIARDQSMPIPR